MTIKMEITENKTCVNFCTFIYRVIIYFIFFTLHDKQSCCVINSVLIKCLHFYQANPHFICGLYNAIIKYVCNKDLLYEGRVTISSPSLWSALSTISYSDKNHISGLILCFTLVENVFHKYFVIE